MLPHAMKDWIALEQEIFNTAMMEMPRDYNTPLTRVFRRVQVLIAVQGTSLSCSLPGCPCLLFKLTGDVA